MHKLNGQQDLKYRSALDYFRGDSFDDSIGKLIEILKELPSPAVGDFLWAVAPSSGSFEKLQKLSQEAAKLDQSDPKVEAMLTKINNKIERSAKVRATKTQTGITEPKIAGKVVAQNAPAGHAH